MSSEKQETAAPASPDVSLQLETFLEVNKKKLLIAVVVAAVVGVAYYVIDASRKEKETSAATALALLELNKMSANPGKPPEFTSEEFFKISSDYAGTTAAEQASLRGALALFEAGKFADAQQKFDEFSKNFPESIVKNVAELGVAASLEGQKQFDKAAEAYQRVVTAYTGKSASLQAKLALGNLQEMKGQSAQALKLYEEVINARNADGVQTGWSSEASARKSRLIERHPELASVSTPATVATPAGIKPAVQASPVPVKK